MGWIKEYLQFWKKEFDLQFQQVYSLDEIGKEKKDKTIGASIKAFELFI